MIDDHLARLRALDPDTSFIVQAPAGSGKTELLIQRYLRLLALVDLPEAITAITFTKKAAGEMRARVLEALRDARTGVPPEAPHRLLTFELAQQALAQDEARQWRLLENPARMRVQTIDALCASITRQMPWLSRFGGFPDITEKANELYQEAARHTLRELSQEEGAGHQGPLSVLLLHLDNDFGQAEKLIARMLEKRDQWLRHTGVAPDLAAVRAQLEESLDKLVCRELHVLLDLFPEEVASDLAECIGVSGLPACSSAGLAGWHAIAELMLTKGDELRKQYPRDLEPPRDNWNRLVRRFGHENRWCEVLKDLRQLPPARFEEAQWAVTEALIHVLPKAVAHLKIVFRERGRVDFAELSIRASEALGRLESPSDLALSLGQRIEHLLVDEFQDTSYTQFALIEKLTAGWEPGDGRTLFLVGDPMQSIYRFREADVSLFLKARKEGIGDIELEPITLLSNFRSDPAIVAWVNETFEAVLPKEDDIDRGAVAYTRSVAGRSPSAAGAAPTVHAFIDAEPGEEATQILNLLEAGGEAGTTAILVRARSHLVSLITALRQRGIPFQAIEIDQLGERAIILDLMALTFALLHFADRISWLAILRAPWCGLTLEDLHAIAAGDTRSTIWELLRRPELRISTDGSGRLRRCLGALDRGVELRGRVPLRELVEQTWLQLGGPACALVESDLADAAAYFELLQGIEQGGDLESFQQLRQQVTELFAQPDSRGGAGLQIMTIHKAKGLEFDTVMLPGLGQTGRIDEGDLLIFEEQQGDLLMAPKKAAKKDNDPIYQYLKHLGDDKTEKETGRLLYVAATRARNQLHLLGSARVRKNGTSYANQGSFLELLWPAMEVHFEAAAKERAAAGFGLVGTPVKPVRQIRRLTAQWELPERPARGCLEQASTRDSGDSGASL